MIPSPTWEAVTTETADTLDLTARGSATGTADAEWGIYLEALRTEAIAGAGDIDVNALRKRVRGLVYPKRLGAFAHRATSRGLVVYSGEYVVSDDHAGRNAGRPVRQMRATPLLFAASP